MTVIRCGDESLEALYHRGRGAEPVVFAAGHPRLYGTMESAVLAELAWALTRRGHATLRFNWRGVGASTGESVVPALLDHAAAEPLDAALLDEPYEDLCAAIDQQLQTSGQRNVAVVGYSFGAAVAARAALEHDAVDRLVLVAPPVDRLPFDFSAITAVGVPVFIACGEHDRIAPPDLVAERAAGAASVHRIAGAAHEFARGLGPLGSFVASAFPVLDEPLF